MPITRVPIQHKFGIISHSQRLELQERLLKQSYLQAVGSKPAATQARNPIEVTDEFISQYNGTKNFDEKERLDDLAKKMLERIKRRAGLRDGGKGRHVDLPIAWTELSQLAQCKGNIQEDCLDVLITSLDQAPLSKAHIPALFYLAETCLYWLRTDAINQPYLRTGEIKLLKMGQLVFTRLFYHHMAGQLQGQNDFKSRLFTYLDGFSECQEAYNPYPNALLSLRYINEIGKIVIGDANIEPGEVKEGDVTDKHSIVDSIRSSRGRESTGKASTEISIEEPQFREVSANYDMTTTQTSKSAALSSSVHDLSPTLWHSLDVWRCASSLGGGLEEALYALAQCGKGVAHESWVDAMCALSVLSEAAKANNTVLKAMQNLARGVLIQSPRVSPPGEQVSARHETMTTFTEDNISVTSLSDESEKSAETQPSHQSLSDIYERTEEDSASVKGTLSPRSSERPESRKSEVPSIIADVDSVGVTRAERESEVVPQSEKLPSQSDKTPSQSDNIPYENDQIPSESEKIPYESDQIPSQSDKFPSQSEKTESKITEIQPQDSELKSKEVSFNFESTKLSSNLQGSAGSSTKDSTQTSGYEHVIPGTGWRAEVGTDFSGRVSQASSVPTFTNTPNANIPGLHGWHWEVGITYTELMADIVLHGSTSNIQKRALVGNNTEYTNVHKRETYKHPMSSSGLLDLVNFRAMKESDDNSSNDWSWRIRYAALQGLVKICRCCANDRTKDGIRTVAWTALVRAHSVEKDDRVLEALKVGQVDANIETLITKHLTVTQSTIGAKMASTLAKMYLPPLPPPVETKGPRRRPKQSTQAPMVKSTPRRQPMRTSLKDELTLASVNLEKPPDYNTRMGFDLKRMVEDQWRKELQARLEEEEDEKLIKLDEEQKEEEDRVKQREIKKIEKLKGKSTEISVS